MLIVLTLTSLLGVVLVYWKLILLEKARIAREKQLEKWLFDSLYSLNPRTLLPKEIEKPMINKKTLVHKPELDPMFEFKKFEI